MANLQLIKTLAETRKLPLTKLAEKVGISEQQIHLMCRKNSTKIETLEKIAKILQVPVSYFFEDSASQPTFQQTVLDSHGIVAQQVQNLDNRTMLQQKEEVEIDQLSEKIVISPDIPEDAKHVIRQLQTEVAGLKALLAEKDERINEYKERVKELKDR